jgi:hypothetical protein
MCLFCSVSRYIKYYTVEVFNVVNELLHVQLSLVNLFSLRNIFSESMFTYEGRMHRNQSRMREFSPKGCLKGSPLLFHSLRDEANRFFRIFEFLGGAPIARARSWAAQAMSARRIILLCANIFFQGLKKF